MEKTTGDRMRQSKPKQLSVKSFQVNNFVPEFHLPDNEVVAMKDTISKLVYVMRKGLKHKNAKKSSNGLICPICLRSDYTGFMNRYHCVHRKCEGRGAVDYVYFMNHLEEFIEDILLGIELYHRKDEKS